MTDPILSDLLIGLLFTIGLVWGAWMFYCGIRFAERGRKRYCDKRYEISHRRYLEIEGRVKALEKEN